MKLPELLEDVFIRIVDGEAAFVCTVRRNGVLEEAIEFKLVVEPELSHDVEPELSMVRRNPRRSAAQVRMEREPE